MRSSWMSASSSWSFDGRPTRFVGRLARAVDVQSAPMAMSGSRNRAASARMRLSRGAARRSRRHETPQHNATCHCIQSAPRERRRQAPADAADKPAREPMRTFWRRCTVDLDARTSFRGRPAGPDRPPPARPARPAAAHWQSGRWPHGPAPAPCRPRRRRHARRCTMPSGRLARWRFTLARNVQALRLRQAVSSSAAASRAGEAPVLPTRRCPSCHAPLPPDSDECPVCDRDLQTPPSTWVLLRLWRFARPYRRQLLAGFAADAGLHRRHAGAALPDDPADGRHPDPVPERAADRPSARSSAVPGRRCWPRRWPAGAWAGRAPTCWRWCPSASAPTCAPPPSTTCSTLLARLLRRQAHRRPDGAHRLGDRPHQRLPVAARARLRDRRADDRDDGGHPVLDQPAAGGGHAGCRCPSSPG